MSKRLKELSIYGGNSLGWLEDAEEVEKEITMATIRAYTTIEQSRKLAEILSIESADMCYPLPCEDGDKPLLEQGGFGSTPSWSLAALLGIIPKRIKEYNVLRIDIDEKYFSIWYDEVGCGVNNKLPDITMECTVDACYEMILKLHELKIL